MPRRMKGEGSVYLRPDGRWVGMVDLGYVNGKRRRKAIYGNTQREAVKKLTDTKRAIASGTLGSKLTVEVWMRHWLDTIASVRVRPRTLIGYRQYVERHIIPAIGRRRLDALRPEHIRAMYAGMHDKHGNPSSRTTQLQAHHILSRALKVAEREGHCQNMAAKVDGWLPDEYEGDALNSTEAWSVIEAAAGDRLESRWITALMLGIRQGEALGLAWDQVNLEDGWLRIDRALQRLPGKGLVMVAPKSRMSKRPLPLPPQLWASLRARHALYLTERPVFEVDLGLVWCEPNGKAIDPRRDWAAWKDLLRKAEVNEVRLHDARHSAATLLSDTGAPEAVRQAILGHSSAAMTARYTHPDLSAMRKALDALEAHVRPQIEA